jgi:hypothetical protein
MIFFGRHGTDDTHNLPTSLASSVSLQLVAASTWDDMRLFDTVGLNYKPISDPHGRADERDDEESRWGGLSSGVFARREI